MSKWPQPNLFQILRYTASLRTLETKLSYFLGCIFLGGILFFYADMQMKPFIMHRKGLRKPLNHFVLL
jgi:hypothetical protein